MGRLTIRGVFPLFAVVVALYPWPVRAQSPPCNQKQLPYPTLTQEIHNENAGQAISGVVVGDVRIEGDVHDRDAVQKRILTALGHCDFVIDAGSVTETASDFIRSDFRRRGYYEALVTDIKMNQLDLKEGKQRMAVIASVKEGNRYRLKRIIFENSDIIRESALRKRIPLRDGEILDVERIREGILKLIDIFGSLGFIDATFHPDFQVDQTRRTISIVMKIFAGRPYTIENVEVIGLSAENEAKLRSFIAPPDLCSTHLIEAIFLMNKPLMPAGTRLEDVVQFTRNSQKGTVSVFFDFRNPAVKEN